MGVQQAGEQTGSCLMREPTWLTKSCTECSADVAPPMRQNPPHSAKPLETRGWGWGGGGQGNGAHLYVVALARAGFWRKVNERLRLPTRRRHARATGDL